MKIYALTLATAIAGLMAATPSVGGEVYPNIADTSHASLRAVKFFQGYFTAKSQHNTTSWLQFFNPTQLVYYDATLGWAFPNRSAVELGLTEAVQSWAENATSYPLRILGNTASAVVHYVNTPGLFGAEIRSLSAIDFRDVKVTRQVDYWDGRGNSVKATAVADNQYPNDLGLATVEEQAASEMKTIVRQLNAALAAGNATAAAALFSYDAVFEDYTLRNREEGRLAIGLYLQRALPYLPYGPGTTVSHVLGSARGGGYEWQTDGQHVRNGITALELDGSGSITRFTTVWDGSRMNDIAIQALAMLCIET